MRLLMSDILEGLTSQCFSTDSKPIPETIAAYKFYGQRLLTKIWKML